MTQIFLLVPIFDTRATVSTYCSISRNNGRDGDWEEHVHVHNICTCSVHAVYMYMYRMSHDPNPNNPM